MELSTSLMTNKQSFMCTTDLCAAAAGTKLSDKFTGTVCEIVSGDCIVVRDAANGAERRVNLSSIRAPRLGRKGEKPEDWAVEAKEFLRSRLIGTVLFKTSSGIDCRYRSCSRRKHMQSLRPMNVYALSSWVECPL